MGIFRRIGRAIKQLNRRLSAGSTGRPGRDVSMLENMEREQFEPDEDEHTE